MPTTTMPRMASGSSSALRVAIHPPWDVPSANAMSMPRASITWRAAIVPASQQSAKLFSGDFEMIIGGMNPSDADASASFLANLVPGGSTNISGVDDPALAEAARALKAVETPEEQKAAFHRLQEEYNRVMPFAVFANAEEYVAIDESVKGVKPTVASTMLFDGAYLEK
ncbi:hypothetical protein [Dietzia sp. Die43]|uniref:hypothetical protein n=1 Tax=Dietzia sp. Die43 TaxID=2926011 RepID=UPI00211873DC|nr:hypothetical protein [Dietzia sp. Die43]